MTSLQTQAISGVKWTTLQTVLMAGTGPILQVIKARFLIPEEFAHIAVIMIFIGLFRVLENFGISQAIIQRDSIDKQEASSLFFFNIFLSLLFGALLFYFSPFIAGFFSLPDLGYYLKFTALVVVIGGPAHLFRAFLEKHLLFKELSLVEMARNVLMLGLVTSLLILGFGVIGVIYGNIISTLITTIAVVFLCLKHKLVRIYPYFNSKKMSSFLSFGLFVSGKQLMTYCAHRMDEVVIGYFLAPETLGIYHFGKHMLETLRGLITQSFAKVLFPVFSKLKHDSSKISFTYNKVSSYISFVSFPVFIGIAVTAHLFVPVLFGEQWVDSVIVFQAFSLALLLMVLTANVSTSLLYSVNKPDIVFYIDIITNLIYFITLYVFAPQGMIAVLTAYIFYVVYKTLSLQYFANNQLIHSFSNYLLQLMPALLLSIIMAATVLGFQRAINNYANEMWQLIGSIAIGIIVYTFLGLLLQKQLIDELKIAVLKGTVGRA